jgi:alpha-L-glutamate ligase-like protein
MFFSAWRKLKEKGVIGMNQRNANYILKYNQRKYYPLVDDKYKTKQLSLQYGVATPQLYAHIEQEHQLKKLGDIFNDLNDFVIKPANGAGGDGIIVISSRVQGRFRKNSGKLISLGELQHHCANILAGLFSLGGHRDSVLIEHRVKPIALFSDLTFQGVPDIRVIVLKGYPVFSMVRLPTQQSDGKANLHQGAIGVGINIVTGITESGVWFNEPIDEHPDTGTAIAGTRIPHWQEILQLAANCYEMTKLGYLGVDIVIDEHLGPMLLEINARPGLSIQIANNMGMKHRFSRIEKELVERNAKERVEFVLETFAA